MQGTTRRRSNSKGPTISSVGTQQEDRIVTDVKEMQGTELALAQILKFLIQNRGGGPQA